MGNKKKNTSLGAKKSTVKNNRKERKGMKPETKEKLKTGFLTIISNEAVVRAGRDYSWWMPLILGLFSAILALVPSFAMSMTANIGKTFLGDITYSYDIGLYRFQDDLETKKDTLEFTVVDKTINVKGWEDGKWLTYDIGDLKAGGSTTITPTTRYAFEVFYNDPKLQISDEDFFNRVSKNMNPYSSTPRVDGLDGNSGETYRTNFMIFNQKSLSFAKFPRNATSSGSRITVLYDALGENFNFRELSKLPEDVTKGTQAALTAICNNYIDFINKSYDSTKVGNAFRMAGIMLGVNVGVILLFGFVIWLMTRGKHNPFRGVTILEGFKMAGWASPSPAVLSMFGFLLSSYASFIFIFLFGIRVMWMSMRALRPYDTAPSK